MRSGSDPLPAATDRRPHRSSRLRTLWAALLAAGAVSLATAVPGLAETGKLDITGASTIAPLMNEIARRYEEQHAGVRIDVQTGGSSRGIKDVRDGTADIGMVSRALKPSERDLKDFLLARDGVCMILHADNTVNALSLDQIKAIYTGAVTNWKEVGGPDRPITVVSKAEGRSTLEIFVEHTGLAATDLKPHNIIGDNEQGIKAVAGNPGAIGYVSIGSAEFQAGNKVPIKLLPIGTAAPTSANVANGTYRALRDLNLVTLKEPEGLVKALLDYARSPAVDDLIKEQFFVPPAR